VTGNRTRPVGAGPKGVVHAIEPLSVTYEKHPFLLLLFGVLAW
jgi:hypothetical protein